uniref:Uncharacterized protein n=1 Tax=Oryza barthii TaxID=65489 RepID=A0A0D3GUF1_9ORYZ
MTSLPKSTTRYCSEGGGAAAELGDDEHSVAVLADAGNTAVGADCPSVHPLQLPHGVGPLNQHGLPEGVNGADLERKPRRRARRATAAACDEALGTVDALQPLTTHQFLRISATSFLNSGVMLLSPKISARFLNRKGCFDILCLSVMPISPSMLVSLCNTFSDDFKRTFCCSSEFTVALVKLVNPMILGIRNKVHHPRDSYNSEALCKLGSYLGGI